MHRLMIPLFFLLLIQICVCSKARRKESRRLEAKWKRLERHCFQQERQQKLDMSFCENNPLIGKKNCVFRYIVLNSSLPLSFRCISESCYKNVFESSPLEEGEVDFPRERQFKQCTIKELKVQNFKKAHDEL